MSDYNMNMTVDQNALAYVLAALDKARRAKRANPAKVADLERQRDELAGKVRAARLAR